MSNKMLCHILLHPKSEEKTKNSPSFPCFSQSLLFLLNTQEPITTTASQPQIPIRETLLPNPLSPVKSVGIKHPVIIMESHPVRDVR